MVRAEILHGDCKELLKSIPDNSLDSLATDPPYEYAFMNQRWDGTGIAFDVEMWKEVYRVLKPGAYGAVFGADRRIHRVTCALEDSGFFIRGLGAWISAQVFPKSLDASKAIDRHLGKLDEREVVGERRYADGTVGHWSQSEIYAQDEWTKLRSGAKLDTASATVEAAKWEGWGTALKTLEPWVLVRKPMTDENGRPWTLAENLMRWGVGALNIDGCRLPVDVPIKINSYRDGSFDPKGNLIGLTQAGKSYETIESSLGRWPSMLICSDLDIEGPVLGVEVFGAEDDDLDGVLGPYTKHFRIGDQDVLAIDDDLLGDLLPTWVVCPKVGPTERELGCDDLPEAWVDPNRKEGSAGRNNPRAGAGRKAKRKNVHPTVKPISLMRHIIRMITPRGGRVLDTFAGTASGGVASVWEGMDYLGMELTNTDAQPFLRIGRARLEYALRTPAPPIEARVVKPKEKQDNQLSLF